MIMNNLLAEFETNRRGQFSERQIKRLLYWILIYPITIAFCGLWFAFGVKGIWGWIIGSGTLLIISIMSWQYGLDLWERRPISKIGAIQKERIPVRGPTHYEIVFSDGERLRALSKQQWEALQEGKSYNVFFTKRTKWLLSYQLYEHDKKTEDIEIK